jgi:GT2 family glycosyltransferase
VTVWLTIVTVVKDDPRGLERTFESLCDQDLSGVEYIVIDGSSTRIEVPNLVHASGIGAIVEWSTPAGIYRAMNDGLARASGEYTLFLNAGDELLPRALSNLRASLLASAPTWAYAPVEIVGVDGSATTTPAWEFATESKYSFSRGFFAAHQGTVARTDTLRGIGGFDERYVIAGDYAVFLYLTREAPPLELKLPLARFHEGGVSSTRWARTLREFHRARRSILHPSGPGSRREFMWTGRQFLVTSVYRSPWPVSLGISIAAFVFLGATGVAWPSAAVLVAMVLIQGIGGCLWWRLLQPTRSVPILEAVGMGLGLGTAGSALAGVVGPWWLASGLAVIVWVTLRLSRRLRRPMPLGPLPLPDLSALVAGSALGVGGLLVAFRSYPLDWVGRWTGYHGDMPFLEALGASVATLGPTSSIFLDGAAIRYHVLVYGWAGVLTVAANAAPFVVLTRLLPVVTVVAMVAVAAAWARSRTRVRWAPTLAAVLLILGGCVGTTFGGVMNFDSPSQTMSTLWLLAFSVLALSALLPPPDEASRGATRSVLVAQAMSALVLGIALTGGKVSSAVVAVVAWGFLVLIGLVTRASWRGRVAVIGVALLAGSGIAYFWLLAGSANAGGLGLFSLLDRASSVQGLTPVVTPRGIVAGIVILILAAIPRWAGVAWLSLQKDSQRDPATVYGWGLMAVAVATIALVSGGFNDLWFAVAASAPLSVLSALGVAQAASWLGPANRTRLIVVLVASLASAVLVTIVWTTGTTGIIGDGWRWAGPMLGLALGLLVGAACAITQRPTRWRVGTAFVVIALVTMSVPSRLLYAAAEPLARDTRGIWSPVLFAVQDDFVFTLDQDTTLGWTDQQAAAGAWLRANAEPGDLIATNVTRSALVPALTRLPTVASALRLQAPYGYASDVELALERERESWSFTNSPSQASFEALCQLGVDWVWVDPRKTDTRDWTPFATTELVNDDVILLNLEGSRCQARQKSS